MQKLRIFYPVKYPPTVKEKYFIRKEKKNLSISIAGTPTFLEMSKEVVWIQEKLFGSEIQIYMGM